MVELIICTGHQHYFSDPLLALVIVHSIVFIAALHHSSPYTYIFDCNNLQVICAVGHCGAVLKYCGNKTNLASHLKSHQHMFLTENLS